MFVLRNNMFVEYFVCSYMSYSHIYGVFVLCTEPVSTLTKKSTETTETQESEAPCSAKANTDRMGFSLDHVNRKALVQWEGFNYKPTIKMCKMQLTSFLQDTKRIIQKWDNCFKLQIIGIIC